MAFRVNGKWERFTTVRGCKIRVIPRSYTAQRLHNAPLVACSTQQMGGKLYAVDV